MSSSKQTKINTIDSVITGVNTICQNGGYGSITIEPEDRRRRRNAYQDKVTVCIQQRASRRTQTQQQGQQTMIMT